MADRLIKTTVEGNLIHFDVNGNGRLSFDTAKASQANNDYARIHGWRQRIADAAALDKGATAADKRAAMAELVEWYEAGGDEWDRPRSGGGPRPFDVGVVVEALARVKFAGDVDKANAAIDNLAGKREISREASAKLFAADERIATEIARIKASRAPKGPDADELLGELAEETPEGA